MASPAGSRFVRPGAAPHHEGTIRYDARHFAGGLLLLAVIIACEIGFWLFLLAGLAARYLFQRPRVGAALLVGTVLINVPLLIATVVDLRSGTTATIVHGLAAAYLGYSLAFGHDMVRWTDERFAHRYAGGPPPRRKPQDPAGRARYERAGFVKATVAWAISCGLLLGAIAVVGDASRTTALWEWIVRLTVVLAIWAIWPITYTVRARRSAPDRGAPRTEAPGKGPEEGTSAPGDRVTR